MAWEKQLEAMLENGHLDEDPLADLIVAYVAETGDESLLSLRPDSSLIALSALFTFFPQ
jgi:hypothetical protein